jgi:hypothetical protein
MTDKGKLLRGAPAIAAHVFGPDAGKSEERAIFNMTDDLALFDLGGRIAGYTGVIDARLAEKINQPRQGRARAYDAKRKAAGIVRREQATA